MAVLYIRIMGGRDNLCFYFLSDIKDRIRVVYQKSAGRGHTHISSEFVALIIFKETVVWLNSNIICHILQFPPIIQKYIS